VTGVRLFSQDAKVQALRRAPLFEDLSGAELAQLARVTEDVEVPAGQVLCREGEIGREFFVIIDGEAAVSRRGRHLATQRGGDFFGEISLLENIPRTATVTARTPLRFFVLTGRDFRRLLDQTRTVERKVLRALARRVLAISRDPTLA
jgi:CRP/FNR family transcriptional regulator, cyclic AMP receptor protein